MPSRVYSPIWSRLSSWKNPCEKEKAEALDKLLCKPPKVLLKPSSVQKFSNVRSGFCSELSSVELYIQKYWRRLLVMWKFGWKAFTTHLWHEKHFFAKKNIAYNKIQDKMEQILPKNKKWILKYHFYWKTIQQNLNRPHSR